MRHTETSDGSPDLPRALPWWARPSGLNLLFVLPVLVAVFWAGASDFSGFAARSRNFLSAPYATLVLSLVLVSAVGAWLGENVRPRTVLQSPAHDLLRAAKWVGLLILATYLFWFRSMFLDPAELLAILQGGDKPERSAIGTVVGITSLVNLAPMYFSLAGYLLLVRRMRDRQLIALTLILFLMTLFRAYIWSERLAVAEAVIPLALALLSVAVPRPDQRVRRLILRLGPYAALPVVFVFFAAAEYFRSWPYYEERMVFWEFAFSRFVGYYLTSLNNGAGMLATTVDWPNGTLEHVLLWLHSFPMGIGTWFSETVGLTQSNGAGQIFLQRYGDPEFNTPSSFAAVTLDLGVAGAILYFFLSMFCAGILYSRYTRGDPMSLMLYPSVLVTLFESFRYPYWGTSRALVWLLGTFVMLGVLWACGAIRTAAPSRDATLCPPAT